MHHNDVSTTDFRKELLNLTNVGPATAQDFLDLGFTSLDEIKRADPDDLYERLNEHKGVVTDPCCRDVFASVIHNLKTGEHRKWWEFTPERKAKSRE